VGDVGLRGSDDSEVLGWAIDHDHVLVTEDPSDFLSILHARALADLPVTPVVVAFRRHLPRSGPALARTLAEKVTEWAASKPDPYRHAHWLG